MKDGISSFRDLRELLASEGEPFLGMGDVSGLSSMVGQVTAEPARRKLTEAAGNRMELVGPPWLLGKFSQVAHDGVLHSSDRPPLDDTDGRHYPAPARWVLIRRLGDDLLDHLRVRGHLSKSPTLVPGQSTTLLGFQCHSRVTLSSWRRSPSLPTRSASTAGAFFSVSHAA